MTSRDPERSNRDPNTLRAQYLKNSWRCYLETIAYIVCYETVRMVGFPSDSLASYCYTDHAILLSKLTTLNLPDNWIVSFLSQRTQCVKVDGCLSNQISINRGIVQGSGVEPMLYTVMESDLRPLSKLNMLFKYANDRNLIVLAYSDIALAQKFVHIKKWAEDN